MSTIRPFAIFCLVTALTSPAWAQDSEEPKPPPKSSYWSMVFHGGMLMPLGETTEIHQRSLIGGVRVGWVGRHGLGLDVVTDYSPLSRKNGLADETYETHFAQASLMPRFTLGKKTLRLWLAAGGGVAYEHSVLTLPTGDPIPGTADNALALAGTGAVGLEFHFVSGMGLAVMGSYDRLFGELEYELVQVTGGLAFTFR